MLVPSPKSIFMDNSFSNKWLIFPLATKIMSYDNFVLIGKIVTLLNLTPYQMYQSPKNTEITERYRCVSGTLSNIYNGAFL